MKKLLVMYVAIGLTLLVGINIFNCFMGEMTDEELMNKYIAENYNDHCYGTLMDCTNEECIKFMVQENGVTRSMAIIEKDYYQR